MAVAAGVLLLGSVALAISALWGPLSTWWLARIERYASWMSVEFDAMFREMSVERAQRIITATIAGGVRPGPAARRRRPRRASWPAPSWRLGGYFGPRALVAYLRKRRLDDIDNQLVDAFQMMANGLKAGLSLQQSMELVAREMKPPISDEFGRVVKEIHLGELTDDALQAARRARAARRRGTRRWSRS